MTGVEPRPEIPEKQTHVIGLRYWRITIPLMGNGVRADVDLTALIPARSEAAAVDAAWRLAADLDLHENGYAVHLPDITAVPETEES